MKSGIKPARRWGDLGSKYFRRRGCRGARASSLPTAIPPAV